MFTWVVNRHKLPVAIQSELNVVGFYNMAGLSLRSAHTSAGGLCRTETKSRHCGKYFPGQSMSERNRVLDLAKAL